MRPVNSCNRAKWTEQEKKDGRPDIKKNDLKLVDESFDDKLVLDDGTQRIEFHFFGHAHTPGASAWIRTV